MIVFVYGSLRAGFGNHSLLRRHAAPFVGYATTPPEYTLLNLGAFPGLISGGETAVRGEMYDIGDDVDALRDLDRLEGHPSFYRRTEVEVTDDAGETVQVSTYILNSSWSNHDGIVESGDWNVERGREKV